MTRKSLAVLAILALIVALLVVGCTAAPAQTRKLSLASGPTSGVYYPYGGGVAKVISQYVANTECTAEATAASVDNCKLIKSGKADLTLVMGDVSYDALNGTGKFVEEGKIPIRALAVLYGNYMHIVTTESSGIKSVAELKGKRVSTGAAGSGTEVKCSRVLEAYGIDISKDITQERLDPGKSAEAIKDRKLDAFCWDGGLPTSSIMDLAATPGTKLVLLGHEDAIAKMNAKYGPVYFKLVIPKGTYQGVDVDTPVAGVANILAVNEKMDEQLAYNIIKAIFEHKADLVAIHKEAEKLSPENAVIGATLPYHPGAIKYFKEKGVWKQ